MERYLPFIAIAVIVFALLILNLVRKNRLNLKYALVWLFLSLLTVIVLLWPGLLVRLTTLVGFKTMSNMVFVIAIIVLTLICLSLTVIVSTQSKIITLLIQEVSMLKSGMEDKS